MSTLTNRDWIDAIPVANLEAIFHKALGDGDTQGVDAVLQLLAVKDPHRAQHLLDSTRLALDIAKAGPANVAAELRAEADRIEQAGAVR